MSSAISFTEAWQSRSGTSNPATEVRRYTLCGSTDANFVKSYALAGTPSVVSTPQGTIYRQDIKVNHQGNDLWQIDVPYAKERAQNGDYRFSFDTTGGTIRLRNAKAHVNSYGTDPPDHKGAIQVKGDTVEGVDIVIPALRLEVTFRHPLGVVTMARVKALANITGTVNSDTFLTFAAGELLFLGATGADGRETEAEVTYRFAASNNTDNLTVGDIANIAKKGHEYLWIEYKDAVSEDSPVKQPEFVHVERVYEEIPFALNFGWS